MTTTNRVCTLCLDNDNSVISMENVYSCGCRFDFHPHCFETYQQNFNGCMYCRGTPPIHNNNDNNDNINNINNNNNRRPLRDAMFHQDWTRLMRILNRVQNRYIIAYEWNDPRYLRLMNHINVLQNELVNLALVDHPLPMNQI